MNGDTVIVRPGTYVENIDFLGKAVTLQSERGAAVTTIDGNQAGTVVTFGNGEQTEVAVLDGFTVTNGNAGQGGGITCLSFPYSCDPIIRNNIISGNTAGDLGGAIYCYYAESVIWQNTISENSAGTSGGGIHLFLSNATIFSNIISGNTSATGGGIYNDLGIPKINNNTILKNTAAEGGGIYLGSGIAEFPYSTPHGDFFLNRPPLWRGNIGTVNGSGFRIFSTTVPTSWTSGSDYALQALVGPRGGPWTVLTNAEELTVE